MKTEDLGKMVAKAAKRTAADHFNPAPVVSPELVELKKDTTGEVAKPAPPAEPEGRANVSVFGPLSQINRIKTYKERVGGTYAQVFDNIITAMERVDAILPPRMSLQDGLDEMLDVYERIDRLAAERRCSPSQVLDDLLKD